MRACFLGQNVCALGYGVAIVQSAPAESPEPQSSPDRQDEPSKERPASLQTPNRMFEDLRRQLHA